MLQSIQDPTQSVTADYRYISSPGVLETRFNSAGTGLTITFDQPTDRAGASAAQVDCGLVIQVPKHLFCFYSLCVSFHTWRCPKQAGSGMLGRGAVCTWQSSSVLSILFGVGPTLVPGDSLSLVAGKIRSRAGLSSAASSKPFTVLAPLILTRPGPITMKGPAEIDTCSDLQVYV